jgi:hypothetical protein
MRLGVSLEQSPFCLNAAREETGGGNSAKTIPTAPSKPPSRRIRSSEIVSDFLGRYEEPGDCQQIELERTHHPQLPAADLRQIGNFQPRGVGFVRGQRDGFSADADERVAGVSLQRLDL